MCLVDKTFYGMFKDTKRIAIYKRYLCGLRYKQAMDYVREKYLSIECKVDAITVGTDTQSADEIVIDYRPIVSGWVRSHYCTARSDSRLRSLMYKILDPKTVFKGHKLEGLQKVYYGFYMEGSISVRFTHRDRKLSKARKVREFFLVE